jgi:hypothetical protein
VRVFENRLPKTVVGFKEEEVTGARRTLHVRQKFTICSRH